MRLSPAAQLATLLCNGVELHVEQAGSGPRRLFCNGCGWGPGHRSRRRAVMPATPTPSTGALRCAMGKVPGLARSP